MKKIILALAGLVCCVATYSARFDYKFTSANLAEALSKIAEENPDLDLNFIYNELDNYKISANIHTDDPLEALRQVIGLNPVSVISKGDRYYIEALQHGRFAYSGLVTDSDREPVPGASVYLLEPNDSSVITYGSTDPSGRFNIPCDHKKVLLKVTAVGYTPAFRSCSDFHTGTTELKKSPVLLNSLNVEAKLVETEGDRTIYLPTTRQKNASATAMDLLQRMAINRLIVNPANKSVTTNSGQEVKIFINKRLASQEDLDGMRITDVRRVELLDNPSDARFMGANYAINFIVQEYEYGGYTKISEWLAPIGGIAHKPKLFSKFSRKRMTYDLFVGPDEVETNHVATDQITKFNLPSGTVERNMTFDKGELKYIEIPVTLRALYSTDKTSIRNTVGYTFHDRYHMLNAGSLQIKPLSDGNYSFTRISPFVNRTVKWNGDYYFFLPKDWSLQITPKFTYGHNSSYSDYSTDIPGETNIINNAKENVYSARLELSSTKTVRDKHNFTFTLDGGWNRNEINYAGTSPYKSHLADAFYALQLRYKVKLKKFFLNVDGGVIEEFISTNVNSFTDPYPFLHLSAFYRLSDKHVFNCWVQYASNTPENSMLSPNIVKSNELLYISGNPELKPSRHTTVNMSYGFNPSNRFSASCYVDYFANYNRDMLRYSLYDDGRAVLRDYINSGDYSRFRFGMNATVRLFNNNLIIQGIGTLKAARSTGYFSASRTYIDGGIYAQYYLGNFNFTGYYCTAEKRLMQNNPGIVRTRSYYYLGGGWSNGNWNASLYLCNFCRTSYNYEKQDIFSPYYEATYFSFNGNYRLSMQLSLTYTFGYGKKINRNDEIGSQGRSSSSILQ